MRKTFPQRLVIRNDDGDSAEFHRRYVKPGLIDPRAADSTLLILWLALMAVSFGILTLAGIGAATLAGWISR